MSKHVVGNIEGYDVVYVDDRDTLFCKNTTMPYQVMKRLVQSSIDRQPLKADLVYHRDGFLITLGCLTTTMEHCNEIIKIVTQINKLDGTKRIKQ